MKNDLQTATCPCACHDNVLKRPYEHDTECCEKINGSVLTAHEQIVRAAQEREDDLHTGLREETQPTQDKKIRAEQTRKDFIERFSGTSIDFNYRGDLNTVASWFLDRFREQEDELRAAVEGMKPAIVHTHSESECRNCIETGILNRVLKLLGKKADV